MEVSERLHCLTLSGALFYGAAWVTVYSHLMLSPFSISLNTFKWNSHCLAFGIRRHGYLFGPFQVAHLPVLPVVPDATAADGFSLLFFPVCISSLDISFHACLLCAVFPFIANSNCQNRFNQYLF